jgi:beta-mannosidase
MRHSSRHMPAERTFLTDWSVASAAAGSVDHPDSLAPSDLQWLPLEAPGTAAAALRLAGLWTDESVIDFDADDWWFRTSFPGESGSAGSIRFAGLATIADVWLNGEHVLHSEDMFIENTVAFIAAAQNDIVIVCRSLRQHLAKRRPRARWKTRLVEAQQLRWVRTCLLGRMPTWPPNAAPVGPWRPVEVVIGATEFEVVRLRAGFANGVGRAEFTGVYRGQTSPESARLRIGDTTTDMLVTATNGGWSVTGVVTDADVDGWFPATHGVPTMYPASMIVDVGHEVLYDLGQVGFRSLEVDQVDGAFRISVNDVPIFCRGACWVPIDPVGLWCTRDELRTALLQVVDAGMNMVRLTGTMVPEQDEFYELCDELGVLVWQDLMFANMEYPIGDPDFAAVVRSEVLQLLNRLDRHPSLTVVCGGSEVEQQAAMMGLDTGVFTNELGRSILANLVGEVLPDVQYVPCSPSGGVFAFTMSTGVSHYYGVSAYLRPLDDARRANVRFTSECLAFSNVPCPQSVDEFLRDGERPCHAPRWKARVPRDRGTGWDFEDVRDHYVRTLFGVEPMQVRYADSDLYLDLGRAASCIAIESTVSEWRRARSSCDGALVFTLRDMIEGPGWGLIDAKGRPKSVYYAMARASSPLAVLLSDEGLNGLVAHVHNDRPSRFEGRVRARSFGMDGNLVADRISDVEVPAHGSQVISVDSLFDGFLDLTSAFRFGPPTIDVVSVDLLSCDDHVMSRSSFLPQGSARVRTGAVHLGARAVRDGSAMRVVLTSNLFAYYVSIDAPGWMPEDSWFHLMPGEERLIVCRPVGQQSRFVGQVRALNGLGSS